MKDRKSSFRIFLFILALIVLLISSELVFLVKTNPPYYRNIFNNYFLHKAKKEALNGSTEESLTFLGKATLREIRSDEDKRLVHQLTEVDLPEIMKTQEELEKFYIDYLEQLEIRWFGNQDFFNIEKVYYLLGLQLYRIGEEELVENLWYLTSKLNPDSSYFVLEMVNLKIYQGNMDDARSILDLCYSNDKAQNHCFQYRDVHLASGEYPELGFLKSEIMKDEYYK